MSKSESNQIDKKTLIERLLECPSLKNAETRISLLKMLPPDITDNIKGANTIKESVVNIVDACMSYPSGLKHLFEAVRFFDEKTEPFKKLNDFLENQQLVPKLPPPDFLINIETTITTLMAQLNLSSQVKPRDEFTPHNHTSLQLIREAMIQLKQLPAQMPEYSRVSLRVGSALSSTGELLQAERLFTQVIENTNKISEKALAYFNLFQVQLRRNAYQKALDNLQAAIAIDAPRYALHDVARYPIIRLLGAGGMGCVFLCHDQLSKNQVVVKCFWEGCKEQHEEVFGEMMTMQEIAGDYVPKPLDCGYVDAAQQERPYFVTEYIEGVLDGETWLDKYGKLGERISIAVGLQIAKGLQIAHEKDLCHLDLKPANLLLKTTRIGLTVTIIDFGIAQRIATSLRNTVNSDTVTTTALGKKIMRTLDYAPPEQKGVQRFGNPSSKSDIFAFGVILYRLITGETPHIIRPLPNKELSRLLISCLREDPAQRPSAKQVVKCLENMKSKGPKSPIHIYNIRWNLFGNRREHLKLLLLFLMILSLFVFFMLPFIKEVPLLLCEKGKVFNPRLDKCIPECENGKVFNHRLDKCIPECENGKVFNHPLKYGGFGPKMVIVPPGQFRMGDIQGFGEDDEIPVHQVSVKCFAIGVYEVTFFEYERFARASCRQIPNDAGWGKNKQPVINVSWNDALAYTEWLNEQTGKEYHLPTEAQWEYAARAGTETRYWWSDDIGYNQANCLRSNSLWSGKKTAPVGSFKPNPFGLYDTVGNVWEWVVDPLHKSYKNAPSDERVWEEGGRMKYRMVRGGSWKSGAEFCRSATRIGRSKNRENNMMGFRVTVVLD
jgi:formylglycine-generating enzyme required for sulfatase activity/tetratricopeptide (TPR) repeat protein